MLPQSQDGEGSDDVLSVVVPVKVNGIGRSRLG